MPNFESPQPPSPAAHRPSRGSLSMIVARPTLRLFGVVVSPLQAFLRTEAASGVLLLASAVAALLWANLHEASYHQVLGFPISLGAGSASAHFTLLELINDGLMAIFFFVVGMEIKRELVVGELNSFRKASLPAVAALGGMALPAAIFAAFNWGGAGGHGWGIPMATDIAFCVGILTLLSDRVPRALVVFVTALAIFDDIGGILVIAFFYGSGVDVPWLLGAVAVSFVLFVMNRMYVVNGLAYGLVGAVLWYALHHAGIHATIAGVVLGLMIPAIPARPSREVLGELEAHVSGLVRKPSGEDVAGAEILAIEEKLEELEAPLERFVHLLHPMVAFLIMPVFALANSGVALHGASMSTLSEPTLLGVAVGLFFGKQLGVFLLTLVAVRIGVAPMPGGAGKTQLFGVATISGIGFTVALFIASLAYAEGSELLGHAKVGILLGSLAAGVFGYALLRLAPTSSAAPT